MGAPPSRHRSSHSASLDAGLAIASAAELTNTRSEHKSKRFGRFRSRIRSFPSVTPLLGHRRGPAALTGPYLKTT